MNAPKSPFLTAILSLKGKRREKALNSFSQDKLKRMFHEWETWARPSQLWDPDGPNTQGWMAARGFGKTRVGAERTHWIADHPELCGGHILIGGPTVGDIRDTMVEKGPSCLMATAKPWNPVNYEPSKKTITWTKTGVVGHIRSSEQPRSFRGVNVGFAWCDEIAFWSDVQECWDNIQFSLRIGKPSTCIFTTTPIPSMFIKALDEDDDIRIFGGSSYENQANLDPSWFKKLRKKYEGTDLGEQEIHGKILRSNPNRIWAPEWIRRIEPWQCDPFDQKVVSVDPAGGTTSKKSDEHGIVAVASGHEGQLYTLEDRTVGKSDQGWPEAATDLALQIEADAIVAEINFGGEMVERALKTVKKFRESGIKFVMVRAMAAKAERARIPARIYQNGMGFHVGDRDKFRELEEQMTTWDPMIRRIEGKKKTQFSPDRMDAQVHGYLHLMKEGAVEGGAFDEYDAEELEALQQTIGSY